VRPASALLVIAAVWAAVPPARPGASPAPAQTPQAPAARTLTCDDFDPRMTRADLATRFGDANLADGAIEVGEGMSEPGTIIFGGTRDRMHAFWSQRGGTQFLTSVTVRTEGTAWSTVDGITIGTDLKAIEALNGGPFRLMGFGWDYSGTTMSWSGGRLAQRDTGRCRVRLRLRPAPAADLQDALGQVTGLREFASRHPAMQALNPRVYEMWLELDRFGDRTGRRARRPVVP